MRRIAVRPENRGSGWVKSRAQIAVILSGQNRDPPDKIRSVRYSNVFSILATLASLPFAPGNGASAYASARHNNPPIHAPAPKPTDAGNGSRPLLVCFGDSLTAGAGIDAEQAYPADLQRMLDQQGYNYRVVNAGVSGDTTKDGLNRIAEVLRLHAQVVVVEFGGNDGLRGLPASQAQRNLDSIVRQLKAGGAKVAMAGITLPAQYGGPYIQSFNAMFSAVAKRNGVPLLPFILQDVYGIPGYIQDDGIHPTARGAQQVAVNVDKLVVPLLKK